MNKVTTFSSYWGTIWVLLLLAALLAGGATIKTGSHQDESVSFSQYRTLAWIADNPFILGAGDCVTQPPKIRHRVLEASENLEVIEIGVPAEHVTTIDHELTLPNQVLNPDREFGGQRFCHHKAAEAVWQPWRIAGFEARDTGIADATRGVANVQIARRRTGRRAGRLAGRLTGRLDGDGDRTANHKADILFTFVIAGTMTLQGQGRDSLDLTAGDGFVIPPDTRTVYTNCSSDLELLEVSLPGSVETIAHDKL